GVRSRRDKAQQKRRQEQLEQRVRTLRARGRGGPWKTIFTRKSKAIRWMMIRTPWIFPIAAYNLASIEIQRIYRGKMARRRLWEQQHGIKRINRRSHRPHGRGKKIDGAQLSKYLASVRNAPRRGSTGAAQGENLGFQGWCCVRIQAWWRMLMVQKYYKYQAFYIFGIAALQIQAAWRNYCNQRYFDTAASAHEPIVITSEDVAARILQTAWRGYMSSKIFKYYRDLINFRMSGDPSVMLKTINPQEAGLFDAAMGIHLRFRLGRGRGADFPPVIYYKVFTHNPLCDVNAFAPRDYTKHRPPSAGELHNRRPPPPDGEGGGGARQEGSIRVGRSFFDTIVTQGGGPFQYRRVENNPWRPITVKTLADMDKPP
ncbi:unnamed protein product, partial [Heterosigma akashiwo]